MRAPSNHVYPLERLIAIDPGDKHVGFAWWTAKNGMRSVELDAADAADYLDDTLKSGVQALVIEKFRLYPDKAGAQAWSPMATSEMIGALKWIAGVYGVPVYMQGADIKTPARAQCRARKLEWKDSQSGHASDARLHGWYYLLKGKFI